MVNITRGAAIVGIHEHITRYAPDKSELQLQGESIIKAVDDAGLAKNDVDGLFTASMSIRNSGLALADYLNMYPKMVDNTTVGGGSFEFHLSHALNAIAAGRPRRASPDPASTSMALAPRPRWNCIGAITLTTTLPSSSPRIRSSVGRWPS